jgi:hypothetical protein
MGNNLLTENPFAVLTFIVAPAILTNAASVLAMSTINRMLRARERMHELFMESQAGAPANEEKFLKQVNRVERQGLLLLKALHGIYISIGAFAAASLVTLIGAGAGEFGSAILVRMIVGFGLVLGFAGVGGLIAGCVNLFQATKLSLFNIREEADAIRARQSDSRTNEP